MPDPPASSRPVLPTGIVTFLFTDIEGSTRLWEQHPTAMQETLARHDDLWREAIATAGGVVFKTTGDGFCAAFASANGALVAALAAQRALHTADWGSPGPPRVRTALHRGPAEARADDYFSPLTLSRLARLLAVTHGGQILLSTAIAQEIGARLPPGVSLRDLGERRLRDLKEVEHIYQVVAPGLPQEFPPLQTLDNRPNNLPAGLTPLIGRGDELTAAEGLLRRSDVRLVTFIGPGGTGKTRLSLQVAADLLDEFAHGVYFVALAPLSDAELVAPTIVGALGLREEAGRPLLAGLTDYLRERQILLVLDNFEQVLGAAPLVGELLAAAPRLKILVTSRIVLHAYGEHEFLVPTLALPDLDRLPTLDVLGQYAAVALFLHRARAVKPDFLMTGDNAPAVAAICARLDGLPLAIELAAARTKVFAPPAMLAQLTGASGGSPVLQLLTTGARDQGSRQQSLRGAIDWSYDLLDEQERTLFRRQAIFTGGCTLEAAKAVLDDALPSAHSAFLDGLVSLADKSLLRQREDREGRPRFWMLATIREYALERLAASGEQEALRQAHAAYYLALAEAAVAELSGAQQVIWLDRLEADHDNLRAALRGALTHGEAEPATRLAGALWRFWWTHGHLTEGRRWLQAVLALPGPTPAAVRAQVAYGVGVLAYTQGDYNAARQGYEESLALSRALGDSRGIAQCLNGLAGVTLYQGDYAAAHALFTESLARRRELGDQGGIANSLHNLGLVAEYQGDYRQAITLLEESLALIRQAEDRRGIAIGLQSLSLAVMYEGDYLGAARRLEESLALFRELSDQNGIAVVLNALGDVARSQGDLAQATALIEESLALFRAVGDRAAAAGALCSLGDARRAGGDLPQAARLYAESLMLCRAMGHQHGLPPALERLALVALIHEQPVRAVHLWGAAEARRAALGIGAPMLPAEQVEREQALAAARARLGAPIFAATWAAGGSWTGEDALAYALEEIPPPAMS